MTADHFIRWLADMKAAGLAKSDAECARLLKVSQNTIVNYKRDGGDYRLSLACAALLAQLSPYPE